MSFGAANSPWYNGINERNYASADITVRKCLGEGKTATNEGLERIVTTAAWTHSTIINMYDHSLLALITGSAVTLPKDSN